VFKRASAPGPLWPLINRITLVHERANDATERVGRRSGVGLGFCQDLMERGGDPIPPRRTVMCVIGVAITEERREIAAASISKESLLGIEISADHIRDFREGAFLELHGSYQYPLRTGPHGA
jgi:hypothetical protein